MRVRSLCYNLLSSNWRLKLILLLMIGMITTIVIQYNQLTNAHNSLQVKLYIHRLLVKWLLNIF